MLLMLHAAAGLLQAATHIHTHSFTLVAITVSPSNSRLLQDYHHMLLPGGVCIQAAHQVLVLLLKHVKAASATAAAHHCI
jgi:hypothetical protein